MYRILLPLLLSISVSTFAQEKSEASFKRWLASFSLGNVPVPGSPLSIQPGVEFFITPQISIFNEIGLQTGKNKDFDSTAVNKKYFKYKAEGRYYFLKEPKGVLPYAGIQFTTATRSFDVNKADQYYYKSDKDSVYNYSKASINSPVKTIALQIGTSIKTFKDFYFDISIGGGFRFVNTTYSNVENLQKERNIGFFKINPVSSYRYIGKLQRAQLNLGFRVSYRF